MIRSNPEHAEKNHFLNGFWRPSQMNMQIIDTEKGMQVIVEFSGHVVPPHPVHQRGLQCCASA